MLSKNRGNLTVLVDETPTHKDSSANEAELRLEEIASYDLGTCIILEKVTFEPGKFTINDTNSAQLHDVIILMKEHPTIKLEIGGYTDKSGIPEKNLIISQDRAKSVFDYLTQNGVEPARLTYIGYGDAKPIAPNKYRWGRDKNRRIELKLTAL